MVSDCSVPCFSLSLRSSSAYNSLFLWKCPDKSWPPICPDNFCCILFVYFSLRWIHFLQEFKGYVFKIMGGCDKQGFPMKQGVLTQGRVRILMHRGLFFLTFFTWVLEFKRSSWVLEHCYGGWVLRFEIGILVHGLSHTVLLIDVTYRYPMLPRIWKAGWRASPQVCEGMHCQPWPVSLESGHC